MVGKKKKTTKKKKKVETQDSGEPATEGQSADRDQPTSGGRKKSGKKKKGLKKGKLTVAEKLLVKLEKGVELLKSNQPKFEHFVQIADSWLIKHGKKLKESFIRNDDSGDGVITYDEMKSALYDVECPMNMVEIHLLCKLLDSDNSGEIDYMQLKEGLRHYMKLSIDQGQEEYSDGSEDEREDGNFALKRGQSAKDIEHCRCCKVGLWLPTSPDIQYAEVTMMLITFADTLKKHPCHFTKVVHTHLTVYGLIQLIKSEVGIQSSTISVFRDKTRSAEAELALDQTLEDCGYEGREWHNPMEHVIYYDYTSEFNSCPILMCDHYFTNRVKHS